MKMIGIGVALAAVVALNNFALPAAHAQPKDTLTIGLTLEPPHLDPTAGAAAAIDEIVYANVFEGLTRIDENGAVQPQLEQPLLSAVLVSSSEDTVARPP